MPAPRIRMKRDRTATLMYYQLDYETRYIPPKKMHVFTRSFFNPFSLPPPWLMLSNSLPWFIFFPLDVTCNKAEGL